VAALRELLFSLTAGTSSGFRLVTRPWSTTTCSSTHCTPAFLRSAWIEWYEVILRPAATPASMSVHGPWQIEATGFPSSKKAFTNFCASGIPRSLSGFITPPGSSSAS